MSYHTPLPEDQYDGRDDFSYAGICPDCGENAWEATDDIEGEYFNLAGLSYTQDGVGDCPDCRKRVVVVPFPDEQPA